MTVTLLVTRPRPAADEFADWARQRLDPDIAVLVSPVMRIEPAGGELLPLDGVAALVVTSRHAIAALQAAPGAAGRPCYCVGTATARAARAAGLDAIDAGGTAAALERRLLADAPPGPIVYARGAHIASDLVQNLSRAGLAVCDSVVYHQLPEPLTAAARAVLAGNAPVILPLFSPRSARLLFDAVTPAAPLFVAAISDKVASAIPRATQLTIARNPDAGAMLDCIEGIASQAKRVESGRASK